MDQINVIEYAKQLMAAHGDKAEAEAAQKAVDLEASGDAAGADSWRRVRTAIRELRASNVG